MKFTGMGFLKNPRFFEKYSESFSDGSIRIIVDTQTGVNYLTTPSGITPLLDSNGEPVVDAQYAK